ncbi:HAMP domain-containing sensor histidine kinase [Streptomyces sp. PvR034]|uniref:HAMP domain-containing sensor histidine kinase n=1 Tax=Streptomyces sp. PvR034 TaxID=3156401 RepID=UPI003399928D
MSRPRRTAWATGLRARLVVAFLLATAFGSLLTAVLTFQEARATTLERTQNAAVRDLRTQLTSLAPDLPMPPSAADLRTLALQLDLAGGSRGWTTSAVMGDAAPVSAQGPVPTPAPGGTRAPGSDPAARPPTAPGVPAALVDAVREGTGSAYQRFAHDGRPWLAVAVPLAATDEGRDPQPTQLRVFAVFPLDKEASDISALVTAAQVGIVPALALALVPALLAARRVLLPVRRLRRGAQQVAEGRLDTRLDVTGNDELAGLTATFNTMAATLQRDDAELRRLEENARRFAADVAHELRTPLAAMTAVTDVLDEDAASGALPPDAADAASLVASETRRLARTVEDLMEVARFDAGRAELHAEEGDLRTALATTLRLRGWQGDPRIVVDLPGPLPVRIDTRRIDVVLANLVGNALHHGRPPVTVRGRTCGRHATAVLTVTDAGPGIARAALPHVFDRFFKADSARPRSEGSGLGLAIAEENVRLHGGTLTAANAPGAEAGAVFTLTLPLVRAAPAARTAAADPGRPEPEEPS